MSNASSSYSKRSMVSVSLAALAVFAIPLLGQQVPGVQVGYTRIMGLPDDWTHHRLVFSNPGTEEQSIKSGHYEEWLKIVNDPRYVMHQLKRGLPVQGPSAGDAAWAEALARENRKFAQEETADEARRQPQWILSHPKSRANISKDWSETLGTATAPAAVIYPAKWSFDTTTASCANDFVVYPTAQAGSSSQASIIAYYNLYTPGCSGAVPEVAFAYDTAGGTVSLSPVFSMGGTLIAFIQSSGTTVSLVLLKVPATLGSNGTLGAPDVLTSLSAAAFASCAGGCMTSIQLGSSTADTASSPFYDYKSDSLYVGDSSGHLYKFHPVFGGALTLVTGWPIQLMRGATSDTTSVASPIYDVTSGNVFVGTSGGYFYSVSGSTGAMNGYSIRLDATNGIVDGALVDSTAARAYVFVGHDTSSSGYSGVVQFSTGFSGANVTGTEAHLTSPAGGGAGAYQFAGTFDNTYFTSSNPSSPTGYLYVCGSGNPATLYQVTVTGNTMTNPATAGPAVGTTGISGDCSAITEFYNSYAGATAATGTALIYIDPASPFWGVLGTVTVTVGNTTYTFVTGTPAAANQVEEVTSGSPTDDEDGTAQDMEAVVNADSSECYTPGCIYSGQTANASATASVSGNTVTFTALTMGTGGDFTVSNPFFPIFTTSTAGTNGTATDQLFLSVYEGSPTGCTASTGNGCVLSYDVTTPSGFGTGITPTGTLNLSSPAASPTGGFVVDNDALNLSGGTSQIYIETRSPTGTSPCTGICAVQAAQSVP